MGQGSFTFTTAFIHGARGVGKTRLELELLHLMHEYASNPKFQCDSAVQELKQVLEESKTVILDIRHGSNEAKWPADVILGLRLAHQYWFPYVPYIQLREVVMERANKDPSLLHLFPVHHVLRGICEKPAAPTSNDPSPRIPRMIHIAVDEFQHAFNLVPLSRPFQKHRATPVEDPPPCASGMHQHLLAQSLRSRNILRHLAASCDGIVGHR